MPHFRACMVSTLSPRPDLADRVRCHVWGVRPGWRGDGGKFDGYTGNALPSCGPINSRRNTIYAIVPHYEDCEPASGGRPRCQGGWNEARVNPSPSARGRHGFGLFCSYLERVDYRQFFNFSLSTQATPPFAKIQNQATAAPCPLPFGKI